MSTVVASSADPCSIPNYVKKIVQSIKEIVGEQHSDDDVYSILQECNMDPNETTQKLLYLDTFREVKSKRDRRKESSALATHGRGARGGRGNNFSNFSSSDAGSGRNAAPRRENGVNHVKDKGSAVSLAAPKQSKNMTIPRITKTSVAIPNGSSSLAAGNAEVLDAPVEEKKLGTEPQLPAVTEKSPAIPSQSFSLVVRNGGDKSFSSVPASVSGVYSSASDPVLLPSATQNPGTVGTIKREVGIQQKESTSIQQNKSVVARDGVFELPESEKSAFGGTSDPTNKEEGPIESKLAESNLLTEPSESSSSEAVVASKVSTLEASIISVKANCHSVPETNVRDGHHVIFPNHFQVPEAVKIGLTFGSFEANLGARINHVNDIGDDINTHAVESSLGNDDTFGQLSTSNQVVSSIVQGDNPDHQQSTSPGLENVLPSDDNVPTGANTKSVQSKPELLMLPGGHQNPNIQSVSNYSFGFMPAMPGTQFVQYEGHETQNGNQQVSCSASQPPAVSTSPQPVLFRQPYPPNYYHYPQYISPFYMPPIQQFINTNGLPQQPSSGNIYLPPPTAAAAAPGVKFPLPPLPFKLGTNPANSPPHMGVPSGYGSYTSSPVGFNPSAMASGTTANNEDLIASQLKESHIYTTGPMSEGSPLWIPAPAQDLTRMQISSLYNLPIQGQHLAYAPQHAGHGAFAGIYQNAQSTAPPPNANPLLQQSQPIPAAAETVAQPPQLAQMNWNNTNY